MIHKQKKLRYKRRTVIAELEGMRIPKSVYGERKRGSIKAQLFLKDCDRIAEGDYDMVRGGVPR